MVSDVVVIALVVLGYAVVSARLATSVLTGPIFFTAMGLLFGPALGVLTLSPDDELVILLLEAALVFVLFADASSLDMRRWTGESALAVRLLGVGLPLTMVAGTVVALVLFADLTWWQAALIGVILAPTDAALGQAVVANPRVPAVIRNALNVESGLNDGLALPFVTILIAIGLATTGLESEATAIETLFLALVGSTVIGLAAGGFGGWLLREAARRGIAAPPWQSIGLIAIAVVAFTASDDIGASGFISAWVAGLVTGALVRSSLDEDAFHLPEQLADGLTAIGFLLLGAALLQPVIEAATPATVAYAVLSLTLARLLPVAIAMWRSGFAGPSVLYVGWFGPRGLASIIFAGIVVEETVPGADGIEAIVLTTVLLSIVLHGVTAAWGAARYAGWFEVVRVASPDMPEAAVVADDGVYRRRTPRGGAHHAERFTSDG